MNPQPGEIWLADLGLAVKTRPVVIVSLQDPNPPRSLVLYLPLTTQRRNSPYEVPLPRLPFLDRESVANVRLGLCRRCGSNTKLAGSLET
jgi:mRNA interferase MazF